LRADKDEVKFVVADFADLLFARNVIEKYDLENCAKAVLISPIFGIEKLPEFAVWVAESNLKNIRLNLQIHKYVWGANVHGV